MLKQEKEEQIIQSSIHPQKLMSAKEVEASQKKQLMWSGTPFGRDFNLIFIFPVLEKCADQ